MREEKWKKRDRMRAKKHSRKQDSGRSVFVIQDIQRKKSKKIKRTRK